MKIVRTTPFRLSYALLLVLLLSAGMAMAQNTLTMKGRIVDGKTGEPMAFATVSIPQSMTGVISNEYGEFVYHIPVKFEKETVQISFMGYQTIYVKVADIKPNEAKTYVLKEHTLQLPEIAVNIVKGKLPAEDLVFRAIRNIGRNYPDREALYYGYYRDYIREVNTKDYRNLLEAAVVINDKGFNSYDRPKTKIKIEQLRYSPDYLVDLALGSAYDGKQKYVPNANMSAKNELAILRAHDPIRNHDLQTFSYVYIFDTDFFANHRFSYESITRVDNDTIYCIHFSKSKVASEEVQFNVDGQIFITSKGLAIQKMIYSVDCVMPQYSGRFFDLQLEYKELKNKYYLNYLSLMNYFEYRKDTVNLDAPSEPYFQYRELFINKVQNKPFPAFKPHEVINKSESLFRNKVPADSEFWKNYNYTSVNKLQE